MSGWGAVCVTCGLALSDITDVYPCTQDDALEFQADHRCAPDVRITNPDGDDT